MNPADRRLADLVRAGLAAPDPDPAAFSAGVRRRARRRVARVAALAGVAAALALLAWPEAPAPPPAPEVVAALDPDTWFDRALADEPALPPEYQTLSALFLDPGSTP